MLTGPPSARMGTATAPSAKLRPALQRREKKSLSCTSFPASPVFSRPNSDSHASRLYRCNSRAESSFLAPVEPFCTVGDSPATSKLQKEHAAGHGCVTRVTPVGWPPVAVLSDRLWPAQSPFPIQFWFKIALILRRHS